MTLSSTMIRLIVKTDKSEATSGDICIVDTSKGLTDVLKQISKQLCYLPPIERLALLIYKEGHYALSSTIRTSNTLLDQDIILATPQLACVKVEDEENQDQQELGYSQEQQQEEEGDITPRRTSSLRSSISSSVSSSSKSTTHSSPTLVVAGDANKNDGISHHLRPRRSSLRGNSHDDDNGNSNKPTTTTAAYTVGTLVEIRGVITSIDTINKKYMIRFNHDRDYEHDVEFDDPHIDKIVVDNNNNNISSSSSITTRKGGMKRRVSMMLGEDSSVDDDSGKKEEPNNDNGNGGEIAKIEKKRKKQKTMKDLSSNASTTVNNNNNTNNNKKKKLYNKGSEVLTDKQRKKLQGIELDLNEFKRYLAKEEKLADISIKTIVRQVTRMKNGDSITSTKVWGDGIEFLTTEPFVDMSDPYHVFLEEAIGHETAYADAKRDDVHHRLRLPIQKLINYQAYYYHKKFPSSSGKATGAVAPAKKKTNAAKMTQKAQAASKAVVEQPLSSAANRAKNTKQKVDKITPAENINGDNKKTKKKKDSSDDAAAALPNSFESLVEECRSQLQQSNKMENKNQNEQQQQLQQQEEEEEPKRPPSPKPMFAMSELYCPKHGEEPPLPQPSLAPSSSMLMMKPPPVTSSSSSAILKRDDYVSEALAGLEFFDEGDLMII